MIGLSVLFRGVVLGVALVAAWVISLDNGGAVSAPGRETTTIGSVATTDPTQAAECSTLAGHHGADGCAGPSCCEHIGVSGCCTLSATLEALVVTSAEGSVGRPLLSGDRRWGSAPDVLLEPPRLRG